MPVETDAELAAMFDASEFGTVALLWPGTRRERQVSVHFDRPAFDAETQAEVAVSLSQPSLLGPEAAFDGLAQEDAVRVKGRDWRVYDIQPDGTGVARVILGT